MVGEGKKAEEGGIGKGKNHAYLGTIHQKQIVVEFLIWEMDVEMHPLLFPPEWLFPPAKQGHNSYTGDKRDLYVHKLHKIQVASFSPSSHKNFLLH